MVFNPGGDDFLSALSRVASTIENVDQLGRSSTEEMPDAIEELLGTQEGANEFEPGSGVSHGQLATYLQQSRRVSEEMIPDLLDADDRQRSATADRLLAAAVADFLVATDLMRLSLYEPDYRRPEPLQALPAENEEASPRDQDEHPFSFEHEPGPALTPRSVSWVEAQIVGVFAGAAADSEADTPLDRAKKSYEKILDRGSIHLRTSFASTVMFTAGIVPKELANVLDASRWSDSVADAAPHLEGLFQRLVKGALEVITLAVDKLRLYLGINARPNVIEQVVPWFGAWATRFAQERLREELEEAFDWSDGKTEVADHFHRVTDERAAELADRLEAVERHHMKCGAAVIVGVNALRIARVTKLHWVAGPPGQLVISALGLFLVLFSLWLVHDHLDADAPHILVLLDRERGVLRTLREARV
jgi:hypothetical protein